MQVLKKTYWIWLLHLGLALFFISIPFFTISVQGPEMKRALPAQMLHPYSVWALYPWLRWCCQNAIFVLQFYFIYLLLAPWLITNRKSVLLFVLSGLACILLFTWLVHLFHMGIDGAVGKKYMPFKIRFIDTFIYSFVMVAMGSGLHVFVGYKSLQHRQMESELLFLRSQINPHFLFNTLNNIYTLIVLKSDKAADAMLRLSDMMRFVLYESGGDYILLKKELDYIDNYVALQQIRLHDNVKVEYEIRGAYMNEMIHPMLLIPFIENAFKHGISYSEPCLIQIQIQLNGSKLELVCINNVFNQARHHDEGGSGVGLQNVLRRLELLYPGRYSFRQNCENNIYRIKLTLHINENQVRDSRR